MVKGIFSAVVALSLLLFSGCAEISDLTGGLTDKSSSASPKILREAELGSKWQVTQMEIEVGEGDELSILLKLDDGDEVDGYFYMEKGGRISFQIIGDSLIYESESEDTPPSREIDSDRFSFVASQAQGTTYTLTFRNSGDSGNVPGKAVVFLEVVFPAGKSIFIPVVPK
ncbi:hypothetical protein ACFLVN_02210 [Chloroflexota bacterium]